MVLINNASFDKFSNLLYERLSSNTPTSEDWIRYVFYEAFSKELKLSALDFSFEVLFSNKLLQVDGISKNCRLDALVKIDNYYCAFEIKFLRKTERGRNLALPANTGLLFNDIIRLSHIKAKNVEKYMLYVMNDSFSSYMSADGNNLDTFYNLNPKGNCTMKIDKSFINNHCSTFKNHANKSVNGDIDCLVKATYSNDSGSGYHIRVLQILE